MGLRILTSRPVPETGNGGGGRESYILASRWSITRIPCTTMLTACIATLMLPSVLFGSYCFLRVSRLLAVIREGKGRGAEVTYSTMAMHVDLIRLVKSILCGLA